jgi:hypothetical protein
MLHFRCIVRKGLHGQDCAWHWQHVAREMGFGMYAHKSSATHGDTKCYT